MSSLRGEQHFPRELGFERSRNVDQPLRSPAKNKVSLHLPTQRHKSSKLADLSNTQQAFRSNDLNFIAFTSAGNLIKRPFNSVVPSAPAVLSVANQLFNFTLFCLTQSSFSCIA